MDIKLLDTGAILILSSILFGIPLGIGVIGVGGIDHALNEYLVLNIAIIITFFMFVIGIMAVLLGMILMLINDFG